MGLSIHVAGFVTGDPCGRAAHILHAHRRRAARHHRHRRGRPLALIGSRWKSFAGLQCVGCPLRRVGAPRLHARPLRLFSSHGQHRAVRRSRGRGHVGAGTRRRGGGDGARGDRSRGNPCRGAVARRRAHHGRPPLHPGAIPALAPICGPRGAATDPRHRGSGRRRRRRRRRPPLASHPAQPRGCRAVGATGNCAPPQWRSDGGAGGGAALGGAGIGGRRLFF
mmetsp:Transcript_7227/g.23728  ORF Transcript_7227/g.23728 Transcript_7227/m.23728 type:complete len:223 (+) Transcript_7227:564-1232(+)